MGGDEVVFGHRLPHEDESGTDGCDIGVDLVDQPLDGLFVRDIEHRRHHEPCPAVLRREHLGGLPARRDDDRRHASGSQLRPQRREEVAAGESRPQRAAQQAARPHDRHPVGQHQHGVASDRELSGNPIVADDVINIRGHHTAPSADVPFVEKRRGKFSNRRLADEIEAEEVLRCEAGDGSHDTGGPVGRRRALVRCHQPTNGGSIG